MFIKIVRPLLTFFVVFLFFLPIQASARSFTIDAVDIHAYIFPDGDLYVEELYTYTFEGAYNGTTRIIGDDDHNGIEFFEGYQVPDDAEMGKITMEMLTPLRVELENYTFKVYRPYENETRKVFYRYRISDAIRKYEDIGEFYWRFFDEMGEEDLNKLRIFVQLHGVQSLPEGSYGFMHDLFGGKHELREAGLYYENEKLPGGKPFELRLLFPAEFLSEMDYTKQEEMLPTFLKEEEAYNEKLTKRNEWLPISEDISYAIFFILFFYAIFAIFYPKRFIRWFSNAARPDELEQVDSLTLAALKRNLKFLPQDVNAALFRLYQKGLLKVEQVPVTREYVHTRNAPKSTFKFTMSKVPSNLSEHETFLINWLFRTTGDGERTFSLDQIPLDSYVMDGNLMAQKRDFRMNYKEWKKIVAKDKELREWVKPVFSRQLFLYFIIPAWIMWSLWNIQIGMGKDTIIGFIAMTGAYLFVLWTKRDRLIMTLFLFIMIGAFTELGLDPGMESLEMTVFPLILISAFLPQSYPTIKGLRYLKGLKRWNKSLNKNEFEIPEDPAKVETFFQHAITIENPLMFMTRYKEKVQDSDTNTMYPFLVKPVETARLYSHTYMASRTSYSSSGSSSSGSSGGSGGGGGAGAF